MATKSPKTEKTAKKSASVKPKRSVSARAAKKRAEAKSEAAPAVELQLVNASGKEVGSRAVPAEIFAVRPHASTLHQVVRWQRNKKRAGTHSVLTRAEMSGGGAKPWKQKGTGRARAGSNTSPLWVGGGIAHGPKPRKYDFHVNAKERKLALCSALSARAVEGGVILVEEFGLKKIGTQAAVKVLNAIGVKKGKRTLVVLETADTVALKSLRNIEKVTVIEPAGLNVYDILNSAYVVMTAKALEAVEARLG